MTKQRLVYINKLHHYQPPACYVNEIPLKKVGKNVDGSFTLSNDTTVILSIYYQTVLQKR